MGRWYTGLVHLTENQRTSVRLGPDPPNINKKEQKIMNYEILILENRISTLRGRTGRENGAIIKKLQRRLRKLKSAI